MASTTAMLTALTGLNANARSLDVIGNNVANVNTTAFKSSRMMFSTLLGRTISSGSTPSANSGGTNPHQIGLGVGISGTQRNFSSGTVQSSGDQRDLAIQGNGLFIVEHSGQQFYTRAGAFRQNSANDIVGIGGERLLGYTVDENFNVATGGLVPLNIPVGTMTIAEATRNVSFSGNLNADGPVATRGSSISILGTSTAGFSAIAGANPAPNAPAVIEAATRLVDIEDPLLAGTGSPLFTSGQLLEIQGAEKGGREVVSRRLEIGDTSTLQDLMNFLRDAMSIEVTTGANPDGQTPGVALDTATGVLTLTGNPGEDNDLDLRAPDLRLLDANGVFVRQPFVTNKTAAADGESVRTTFQVYDSLGTPVEAEVSIVLESKSSTGTTWRYYFESPDDSDSLQTLTSGLLRFDTDGQLADAQPVTVTLDRAGTGAATPLTFEVEFSGMHDSVTALTSTKSEIAATFRDGSTLGTLTAFSVGQDGTITGTFSNGLTRTLGQVALAVFSNPEGLVEAGGSLFRTGPNSGLPGVTTPTSLGAGSLVGGALEQSNVDLSEEFTKMILASTGFSANSRVIRTTDELMQQLLVIGR